MEAFIIPSSLEELESTSMGSYMVRQAWDARQISTAYSEWRTRAVSLEDVPELVPLMYSATVNASDLSELLLTDIWQLIFNYMKKLEIALEPVAIAALSAEERRCLSIETTILVYFFTQYIRCVDAETQKINATSAESVSNMQKKSRKKPLTGIGRFANWSQKRITSLECVLQVFEAPVKEIFADDVLCQLGGAVANVVYLLLGNIAVCKDDECCDACVRLVSLMAARYGHGSACPYQVPSLLSNCEGVVPVLVQIFEEIVNRHGNVVLLPDLMRECTSVADSVTGDSLLIRNTSDFLFQLCKRIGSSLISLVAYIETLLSSSCFSLRSAALSSMSELIKTVLTKKDLIAKEEKVRDTLLDEILSHVCDVSAHVRCRAIRLLSELLQANSLPINRQPEILSLVARRLQDTTSTVRKQATQYLIDYIDYNTFLAHLELSTLDDFLEKKGAHVAELKRQVGLDQRTPEQWDEVSSKMMTFFRKNGIPSPPADPNDLERPKGTLQEELARITIFLDEDEFAEALRLLHRCFYWFQESPLFASTSDDDASMPKVTNTKVNCATNGSSENESEETQDNGKSRETVLKGDTETPGTTGQDTVNWFALAMKVYLREAPKKSLYKGTDNDHPGCPGLQELSEQQAQTERDILLSKLDKSEKELTVLRQLKFCISVYEAVIPQLTLMLRSRATSDILAAVAFFTHIITAKVPVGPRSISNMAHLYGHKEESVKKAVETSFENLYLVCDTDDVRMNTIMVARKLIDLFLQCNKVEADCWGTVVAELVAVKKIPSEVVKVFYEILMEKLGEEPIYVRAAALLLIAKSSLKKPAVVQANLSTLIELIATPALTNLCMQALSNLEFEHRWDIDHECYSAIIHAFTKNFTDAKWTEWPRAFFSAVQFIFKSAVLPVKLVTELIREVLSVFTDVTSSLQHSRVFSMVQTVAACLYVFLDTDFFEKIKEGKKGFLRKQQIKDVSETRRNISINTSAQDSAGSCDESEQSGLIGAVADESDTEFLLSLLEDEIMSDDHFLGACLPYLLTVIKDPKSFPCSRLQQQATVSLISVMLLSNKVYDEYISLIFTILERSPDEAQRLCIVTYVPDLCKSFPNSFDPWTSKVYETLKRERSVEVRRRCILVLSDLIMHDQIKVKGTISDVACCLLDAHADIVRMTESLFQQLATKSNSLYNILPDIISRLSDEKLGVAQEDFRKIASFLFRQLSKDKKLENFIEKLCGRFRSSTTDLQYRNLAFCLQQIPYTERSLRKLIDNASCFTDKLLDPEVRNCFTGICAQTAKGAKTELKLAVAELEAKIEEAQGGRDENAENFASNDIQHSSSQRPHLTTLQSSGRKRATTAVQKTPAPSAKKPRIVTDANKKGKKSCGRVLAALLSDDSEDDDNLLGNSQSRKRADVGNKSTSETPSRRALRTRK